MEPKLWLCCSDQSAVTHICVKYARMPCGFWNLSFHVQHIGFGETVAILRDWTHGLAILCHGPRKASGVPHKTCSFRNALTQLFSHRRLLQSVWKLHFTCPHFTFPKQRNKEVTAHLLLNISYNPVRGANAIATMLFTHLIFNVMAHWYFGSAKWILLLIIIYLSSLSVIRQPL